MKKSIFFFRNFLIASLFVLQTFSNVSAQCDGVAMHFDGTNDRLVTNSLINVGTTFTWECWLKTSVINSGFRGIITASDFGPFGGSGSRTQLNWDGTGKVRGTDGISVNGATNVSDNQWHHIAMVVNGTGPTAAKIYVDGNLDGTGSSSVVSINRRHLVSSERVFVLHSNQTVDEVRIWNIARSQADIQATMNTHLSGSESGLLVYYDFNEGVPNGNNTSISVTPNLASTGSGNDATITNLALTGTTSNYVCGTDIGSCSDGDGDGICDEEDNCPYDANADQADTDGDGTGDACDGCPNDPNNTAPGICGCGVSDVDTDGDGTADCNDGCPLDPNKTAPGICGCGVSDVDTDGDGTADCNDGCPNDPNKIAPGQCGCGVADTDNDGDGIANCNDNCDNTANPSQTDSDCDGVGDACDVCPGGDDSVDNNNDGLPDCKYPPAFNQIIAAWKCGNNNSKVSVCHNGNNTLCISYSAVQAHINHGDYIGPCGNASCGQNMIAPVGDAMAVATGIELELFPNPAGNEVNIHLHGMESAVMLTIQDQLGRVVWTERLEEGQVAAQVSLDDNRFGSGIYFVSAISNGENITRRFVIAK
ncbi:MAG: thrombospondin type 3 repeat-containing protein [Bacteroidetes bacterium]|nr:thrombospondin type 3 repeat-containing protein [Bacteroidota bacterium]